MDSNASICIKCGVASGVGNAYCANCGAAVNPNASICTSCGVALSSAAVKGAGKSKLVAGLLAILIGGLGIHNFYLGYTGKAVAQLLITLLSGGLGAPIVAIWALIEGIQILTGSIKTDAKGIPLEN